MNGPDARQNYRLPLEALEETQQDQPVPVRRALWLGVWSGLMAVLVMAFTILFVGWWVGR